MHDIRAFEKGNLLVQPLTNDLDIEMSELINGLVRIFSKREIVYYNLNRQLTNDNEARRYIGAVINGYSNKTTFDYFVFKKNHNGELFLIGTINGGGPNEGDDLKCSLRIN